MTAAVREAVRADLSYAGQGSLRHPTPEERLLPRPPGLGNSKRTRCCLRGCYGCPWFTSFDDGDDG